MRESGQFSQGHVRRSELRFRAPKRGEATKEWQFEGGAQRNISNENMKPCRILVFRMHRHPATTPMLLEMAFVHAPSGIPASPDLRRRFLLSLAHFPRLALSPQHGNAYNVNACPRRTSPRSGRGRCAGSSPGRYGQGPGRPMPEGRPRRPVWAWKFAKHAPYPQTLSV